MHNLFDIFLLSSLIFLVFGFLIIIHELGHFLVARFYGVQVLRFSIGFGWKIINWYDKLGTEYCISIIPFGGHVEMLGRFDQPVASSDLSMAFASKPIWIRVLIILAGPVANMLAAIAAYFIAFLLGIKTVLPVVYNINPGSIASDAGLYAGVRILTIGDHEVHNWAEVNTQLMSHMGKNEYLKLTGIDVLQHRDPIDRHEFLLDLSQWNYKVSVKNLINDLGIVPLDLTTMENNNDKYNEGALIYKQSYSPGSALWQAIIKVYDYIKILSSFFINVLSGKMSLNYVAGSITNVQYVGKIVFYGVIEFIQFLAMVSIGLTLINLFPIPTLDGGELCYCVLEILTGKPVSCKIMYYGSIFGKMLLLAIVVFIFINHIIY